MDRGPFLGLKWVGRGVNPPTPIAPRLNKEWSYTSTPSMCLHGRLQSEIYLHLTCCETEPTKTKYTPEQCHSYFREWVEDGHTAEQFVKWASIEWEGIWPAREMGNFRNGI